MLAGAIYMPQHHIYTSNSIHLVARWSGPVPVINILSPTFSCTRFTHQQVFVGSLACFMYFLCHLHMTSPLLINAGYCMTYQRHMLGLMCDGSDAFPIHSNGEVSFQKSAVDNLNIIISNQKHLPCVGNPH